MPKYKSIFTLHPVYSGPFDRSSNREISLQVPVVASQFKVELSPDHFMITIFLISNVQYYQYCKYCHLTISIILITNRTQLVMACLFLITSSLAVFSLLLWGGFDPNWWLASFFILDSIISSKPLEISLESVDPWDHPKFWDHHVLENL